MKGPYGMLEAAEGTSECLLTGADTDAVLNRLRKAGISVLSVSRPDAFSVRLTVRNKELPLVRTAAERGQCEFLTERCSGGARLRKTAGSHILPLLLLPGLLLALFVSRLFLWEISVVGNETVSIGEILSALSDCGITPGSFWPSFTSDNLRSELLTKLPALAWATVNVNGSRGEVIVRERIPKPELKNDNTPTDLIAGQAGFVTKVSALNGTARVKTGSVVLPGDMLIEGIADSSFSGTRQVHARGSVTAQTYLNITAKLPSRANYREETGKIRSLWALELGNRRINFYRDSSICDAHCDKIEKVWEWKRNGLYVFPVRLIHIKLTDYTLVASDRDGMLMRSALEQMLRRTLENYLVPDGQAEQIAFTCTASEGTVSVCLRARCVEEIAVEQKRIQEGLP